MKTYKVTFNYNGINGVFGVSHTWIDAMNESEAMATVGMLTGYMTISASTSK